MEELQKTGIEIILHLQVMFAPALDRPMIITSWLAEEWLFMLLIPLIFWCIDSEKGYRLLLLLLLSAFSNSLAKWIFHEPRPFWLSPDIKGLYHETSFGFPSGHSQNALVIWFYMGYMIYRTNGKLRAIIAALSITVAVSFSRIYLGVHFPHDIAGGWFLGIIILVAFIYGDPFVSDGLQRHSVIYGSLIAIFVTGLLSAAAVIVYKWNAAIEIPIVWRINGAQSAQGSFGHGNIDPYNPAAIVGIIGAFTGAVIGGFLWRRHTKFSQEDRGEKKIIRFLIGLSGLSGIHIALAAVFPDRTHELYTPFRFLRYMLIPLWALYLAPLLFIRFGLAESIRQSQPESSQHSPQ